MKAPRIATIRDTDQRVRPVAPFSSARLPRDTTRWAIHGCLVHYPDIHHCMRGERSSNSVTTEATTFVRPHKSRMRQYKIKLAHQAQMIGP
jgi:hypothetical protein